MKKRIRLLILIVFCVLSLFACGQHEEAHIHEWDDGTISLEPTLYEEGIKTFTCIGCGESRTERIEKLQLAPIKVPSDYNKPYVVCVNRNRNYIVIYERDPEGQYRVPVRADNCSCGGEDTPLGEFYLGVRWDWATLIQSMYGQYTTRIEGDILFHSVPYSTKYDPATLIEGEYNKLGTTASHGCVRLTVEAAKWIYDNCEKETLCVIVDDDTDCPVEKTEILKIHDSCPWDPTDPNENNPWLKDPEYGLVGHYQIEPVEPTISYNYDEREVEGLEFLEMTEELQNLYNEAGNVFCKSRFCDWTYIPNREDGGIDFGSRAYLKDFKSFEELKAYLRKYFTENFADELIDFMKSNYGLSEDENGLYGEGPGGKGNINYSWQTTGYANVSDIQMLMQFRTVERDWDWNFENEIILSYTYDLLHLIKEDDGWKFTEFSLPPWLG